MENELSRVGLKRYPLEFPLRSKVPFLNWIVTDESVSFRKLQVQVGHPHE